MYAATPRHASSQIYTYAYHQYQDDSERRKLLKGVGSPTDIPSRLIRPEGLVSNDIPIRPNEAPSGASQEGSSMQQFDFERASHKWNCSTSRKLEDY